MNQSVRLLAFAVGSCALAIFASAAALDAEDLAPQSTTQPATALQLQPPTLTDDVSPAHNPDSEELSLGDDLTRPMRRLDTRLQFEDIKGGNDRYIWTTRFERPFNLTDHWRFAIRADLPVIEGDDAFSSTSESGYYTGLGDVLTQVALVNKIDSRWTWAVGTQVIYPSATSKEFGEGKYQAVPSAGIRRTLVQLRPGSYCSALIRYDSDFAGRSDRKSISIFEVGPELNVKLARDWYIDFYPDSDIRYNCTTEKWFVPIDFQVGKRLSPNVIVSLEQSYALIKDYDYYNLKIEFRIGVFY